MRSAAAMEKMTDATLSPIHPDAPTAAIGSTVVEMLTPVMPPLAGPRVNPVSVTVTTELAGRGALVVLMTTTASDMEIEMPPVPPLMATAGTADETKKPEG